MGMKGPSSGHLEWALIGVHDISCRCGLMQACACRYEDWMKMFLRSCGPRCAKVHLLPVFDLTQVCWQSPCQTPDVALVRALL